MYLIPAPQHIQYTDKFFTLRYDTQIIIDLSLGYQEFNYGKILQEEVKSTLGFELLISRTLLKNKQGILLSINSSLDSQAYQLVIEETQVKIIGGDTSGLLYGVQTLRQIIGQEGALIPTLEIKDAPSILNRGFYYDGTRGRIPTLAHLKNVADKMSAYKLNQLQVYVEHSYLFADFSEIWRDDTPLTSEEILELDQYCKGLNIELVPSIASFGHLHKVLVSKTYADLCELENSFEDGFSYMGRMEHHTVDVTNEESFTMIKEMLLEFMPLFSSKQFNICADETFDLGKGKSKTLADKVGVDRVYVDFLKRLCELVKEQGKRPMFWGDIIIAKPEAIKELPEDVICLNWDYSGNVQDTNVAKLANLDVEQYLCPGVHGWRRLLNRIEYAYDNISKMCRYAHQYNALGVLNTDWGDYGHINHPEFSTTGMIYGAAFSWNKDILSFDEINRQISFVEYKDLSEKFVALIHSIGSQDVFLWESVVQFKETSQKNSDKEAMKEYFSRFNLTRATEANKNIDEAIRNMYLVTKQMDSARIDVVKGYLIAGKGMSLFNVLGATISQYYCGANHDLAVSPSKLAVDLEYWFHDYKGLWRACSKEGELYRLQEVINWYGDFLRTIGG